MIVDASHGMMNWTDACYVLVVQDFIDLDSLQLLWVLVRSHGYDKPQHLMSM